MLARPIWGFLVTIIHFVVGIGILVVSAWFIAACAMAGVGFNYVIPAVSIRALALVRILSGYGSLWLSHKSLLWELANIRLNIFGQMKDQVREIRGVSVDRLNYSTEQVASIWASWLSGIAGTLLSLLILSFLFVLIMPQVSGIWGVFVAGFLTIFASLMWLGIKQIDELQTKRRDLQSSIEHHILSAPIWHMQSALKHPDSRLFLEVVRKNQKNVHNGLLALMVMSTLTLVSFILMNGTVIQGQSIYLVLPLLLLTSSDWLGGSFHLQPSIMSYLDGKQGLTDVVENAGPQTRYIHHIHSLELSGFSPKNIACHKVDMCLDQAGITLLMGSSGSGKTKLLQAISGLVPYEGRRCVNNQWHGEGLLNDCIYLEQIPYCLSGTVKTNLSVVGKSISDNTMIHALEAVGLESLRDLDQWLGEKGRLLSGGELKRLSVARALLSDATILLFDEPFEGLDEENKLLIVKNLVQLGMQKTLVIASHIVPESLNWTRLINLDDMSARVTISRSTVL